MKTLLNSHKYSLNSQSSQMVSIQIFNRHSHGYSQRYSHIYSYRYSYGCRHGYILTDIATDVATRIGMDKCPHPRLKDLSMTK